MKTIYLLPLILKPARIRLAFTLTIILTAAAVWHISAPAKAEPANNPPILLGVYPKGWIDQTLVDNELNPLDTWAGKHTSIIGLASDFEETAQYLAIQLDVLWNNGYTPMIDLTAGYFSQPTAYQIASGQKDAALNHWAQVYASWAVGGKFAFISVLPEMNTDWVSYGRDPGNYKLAFARIRQIFSQNGVPAAAVRWVFAPNGWMPLPFEIYYPGDDLVDVVGYSALNQGLCPYSMHDYWFSPEQTVGFSLREMHRMAPDKPVFIVHLGTTAFTASGHSDTAAKDQWLRDTYSYLANDLNIRAVLYYNYPQSNPDCDWAVYRAGANPIQYAGYRDAAQDARYGYLSPTQLASADLTPQKGNEKTFLPLIRASNQQPVLLGSYTQEWPGAQKVVDAEYHAVDSWAGKHLSIAGTFVDILSDPVINIEMQLEMMWDNGYTPFVNLDVLSNSGITAKKIANGQVDTALRNVARSYAAMVQYNHQMAFFAPLQEMNGDWVSYGADPANFKLAYYRIQQIFADEGVPPGSVKWVFAPSGWSSAGDPPFEDYYPGDAYTDILGFSSYNSGYCVSDFNQGWLTPEETYHSFIHRMTLLAPTKPIFIAQTATTALTKQGKSVSAKNQWLVDAYNYLATYPSVRAVIYYNRWNSDCNWAFYQQGVDQYIGYPQGVANSAFGYISPFALKGMNFAWP